MGKVIQFSSYLKSKKETGKNINAEDYESLCEKQYNLKREIADLVEDITIDKQYYIYYKEDNTRKKNKRFKTDIRIKKRNLQKLKEQLKEIIEKVA